VRVVSRLKQDRWTSPEGQPRSKVSIVAEHVEFKPQQKMDGDGKEGEEKPEAATAEETAADDQAEKEGELKEAANF
jgi:single-strand DNA-binding protein